MKPEHSRLIPRKHAETLVLLSDSGMYINVSSNRWRQQRESHLYCKSNQILGTNVIPNAECCNCARISETSHRFLSKYHWSKLSYW